MFVRKFVEEKDKNSTLLGRDRMLGKYTEKFADLNLNCLKNNKWEQNSYVQWKFRLRSESYENKSKNFNIGFFHYKEPERFVKKEKEVEKKDNENKGDKEKVGKKGK